MKEVSEITIRWNDGNSLYITQSEIVKMLKVGEVLSVIQEAKTVAEKLRSL